MLFRKTQSQKSTSQPRGADAAQIRELRVRARRRLIGALALVLAAIIVVPFLFDQEEPVEMPVPVVIPAASEGLVSAGGHDDIDNDNDFIPDDGTTAHDSGMPFPDPAQTTTPPSTTADDTAMPPTGQASDDSNAATPATAPDSGTQAAEPPASDASSTKPRESSDTGTADKRTDDGSVALALLEGRTPDTAQGNKPAQGKYYLQVAAYTTEMDAKDRRDNLHKAGVANAYVESGQSSGRTVYRLRVGPFSSHEAAQAAQTRLRALGYENGLISAK